MENDSIVSQDLREVDYFSRHFVEKLRSVSDIPKEGMRVTVFRVPENIRRTNVDSFEPKMVSLGPYHYGNPRFRATDQRIKLPYATNFFRRTTGMDVNLDDLVLRIVERFKELELALRCAYSEQIGMDSYEFVEMLLLDCAFMAEFLWEQEGGQRRQMEEYSWKWAAPSIVNDMLVLENQFPLHPLLHLLNECTDDLLRQTFFHSPMQQIHRTLSPTSSLRVDSVFFPTLTETSGHLLHLFHSSLVNELWKKASFLINAIDLPSFPGAEILQAMRIQFANKTNGSSFLDITFDESKRSMQIPQLVINDENISLLRNLIAFEQQCYGIDYYVSTYVWFMDCLINTDKDVAVLRKHNIIVSRLRSDEEVAHIFNELRRTDAPVINFDHLYLAEVINNVERYCRNRSNRLWALWNFSWLKQNYFKNRWVTIGVTVAIFFNFLTLVQTVYAILSYAKQ